VKHPTLDRWQSKSSSSVIGCVAAISHCGFRNYSVIANGSCKRRGECDTSKRPSTKSWIAVVQVDIPICTACGRLVNWAGLTFGSWLALSRITHPELPPEKKYCNFVRSIHEHCPNRPRKMQTTQVDIKMLSTFVRLWVALFTSEIGFFFDCIRAHHCTDA